MTDLDVLLDEYLATRRALGARLVHSGRLLVRFVDFAKRHGDTVITRARALEWATAAATRSHPSQWANRLGMVSRFARYANAVDPRHEIVPQGLLPCRYTRRKPYIYSDGEIADLIGRRAAVARDHRAQTPDFRYPAGAVGGHRHAHERDPEPRPRRCRSCPGCPDDPERQIRQVTPCRGACHDGTGAGTLRRTTRPPVHGTPMPGVLRLRTWNADRRMDPAPHIREPVPADRPAGAGKVPWQGAPAPGHAPCFRRQDTVAMVPCRCRCRATCAASRHLARTYPCQRHLLVSHGDPGTDAAGRAKARPNRAGDTVMTHNADFPRLLAMYFTRRLIEQRQASPHTIASYRDTFRLLLHFAQRELKKPPSELRVEDIDPSFVGRLPQPSRDRTRQRCADPQHTSGRDPVVLSLHRPAGTATCRHGTAGPGHAEQALQPAVPVAFSRPRRSRGPAVCAGPDHPGGAARPRPCSWLPCGQGCAHPNSSTCGAGMSRSVSAPTCGVTAKDERNVMSHSRRTRLPNCAHG